MITVELVRLALVNRMVRGRSGGHDSTSLLWAAFWSALAVAGSM